MHALVLLAVRDSIHAPAAIQAVLNTANVLPIPAVFPTLRDARLAVIDALACRDMQALVSALLGLNARRVTHDRAHNRYVPALTGSAPDAESYHLSRAPAGAIAWQTEQPIGANPDELLPVNLKHTLEIDAPQAGHMRGFSRLLSGDMIADSAAHYAQGGK